MHIKMSSNHYRYCFDVGPNYIIVCNEIWLVLEIKLTLLDAIQLQCRPNNKELKQLKITIKSKLDVILHIIGVENWFYYLSNQYQHLEMKQDFFF